MSAEDIQAYGLEEGGVVQLSPSLRPPQGYPGQIARARRNLPRRMGPAFTCARVNSCPTLIKGSIGLNPTIWRNALGPGDVDAESGKLVIRKPSNVVVATEIRLQSFGRASVDEADGGDNAENKEEEEGRSRRAVVSREEVLRYFASESRCVTIGDTFTLNGQNDRWLYVVDSRPEPFAIVGPSTVIHLDAPSRELDPEIASIMGNSRMDQRDGMRGYVVQRRGLSLQQFNALPAIVVDSSNKPDDCCGICIMDFEEGDVLRDLVVCRHKFHKNCIDRWLIDHTNCPECRREIGR